MVNKNTLVTIKEWVPAEDEVICESSFGSCNQAF